MQIAIRLMWRIIIAKRVGWCYDENMKKFFREFKEFIARGNIVDLAVAVIIGAAFSAIVTALTDHIIKPLVNWVLAICGGTEGLESAYTILKGVYDEDGKIILEKSIYIDWGAFVAAIINFIIIAFTVFCIVKAINASMNKFKKLESSLKDQSNKEFRAQRKVIKERAKVEGRPFKIVWQEYLAEQAKAAEEAAAAKAAEEAAAHPSTEALLTDIKKLLEAQVAASSKPTKAKTTKE